MLENKQLSTVQIEDQQIYFVDNENNSYKTNAIAPDNTLVTRLEDAGVEFGTVYQSPTIWDSLLNLAISLLPMILLFWWLNRYIGKKMQSMGGANSMLFGGGKSGAKQYVVCHYPIFSWKKMGRGKILLYGHTHESEEDRFYQQCLDQMQESDCRHVYNHQLRAYNVGCMLPYMNYTPRTLGEIMEQAGERNETLKK